MTSAKERGAARAEEGQCPAFECVPYLGVRIGFCHLGLDHDGPHQWLYRGKVYTAEEIAEWRTVPA